MEVKFNKPSKKCINTQRGLKFIKPLKKMHYHSRGGDLENHQKYILAPKGR
jgi:hypothetical protein